MLLKKEQFFPIGSDFRKYHGSHLFFEHSGDLLPAGKLSLEILTNLSANIPTIINMKSTFCMKPSTLKIYQFEPWFW